MSKIKKIAALSLPLIIMAAVFSLVVWAQELCIEYTETFRENFNTDLFKNKEYSSVANWPVGPITLNWLGGNLEVSTPAGMGAKIYVCDQGDFDGDGYPDLIGLDITDVDLDGNGIPNIYGGKLVLVRNHFDDADLDGVDDDGIVFSVDPLEVYDWNLSTREDFSGPASITVGDYNGDGLLDFFLLRNDQDATVYDNFKACMYINDGTPNDPHFNRYLQVPNLDFTSKFVTEGIYVLWAADHMCSVDIDEDGDVDILCISEDRIFLIRNPGASNFDLANFTITELNYNQATGFTQDMGGSTIDAADFDNDGDLDIIAGSVYTYLYLAFYENDGTGYFTRHDLPILNPDCSGAVATCVGDFNNDGLMDLIVSTDVWRSGTDARLYMYKNKGIIEGGSPPVDFEWRCFNNCDPIIPPFYDTDMGISLDYDLDGDIDVILADANHSGDYYLAVNMLANVYATYGEAWSLNLIPALDAFRFAVTKAQISRIRMGTRGQDSTGLKVEFYLSNNGEDWELYQVWEGADIKQYNDLPVHTFKHFGSKLLWKAILSAPEDPMEEYTGASFDSPVIDEIVFEYIHVERREYSRTSVAATVTTEEDLRKRLIIGSTFYYPSWWGHLRAYDVSTVTPTDTTYSVLKTITRPNPSEPMGREIVQSGVEIIWDSGLLLRNRDASTREIYTALPAGAGLNRVDFTVSNVGTLGPILQDVNNDNEGLIDFVRGEGRQWKLGDSNHSNPIVVGPPDEAPMQMGDGYLEFRNTWKDRKKVLYLGANDGMLHCFDILTGEELWGFIPYNLLPRLRDMWGVAPTGERYFERHVYVDGSPMAADVFIDVDGDNQKEWRTILICGQGSGKGSALAGGLNYYFALDITNPEDPQPLWEFTDAKLGETWSVPVTGKVTVKASDTWAAFFGSGYDNDPVNKVGNRFYAINVETGEVLWSFDASEVNTSGKLGWDIDVTIPGSPSIVDTNLNGYADRVYVADLEGRIWKVDVSPNLLNLKSWTAEVIYADSNNFPIVCKPALWLDPVTADLIPHIYFGTGGDDRAASDVKYSFIGLVDLETPEVEWFLGDSAVLNLPANKAVGDLDVGSKVWADPQVSDFIVYFSTLVGSIDSVDPCESLVGVGKLYARFVKAIAGSLVGSTAILTVTGPQESLTLSIKTRAAVTLGERQRTESATRKREVYIQEYDSTIQKLEQFTTALLKVKSWREVFKIIR